MAKIFGGAGAHAASQSVAVFKKMFLTVTGVIALLALLEGFVSAALLTTRGKSLPLTLFAAAFAAGALWIGRFYARRLDKYESERMSWRMGAIGECEVAAELERLSDRFTVFNNVNTRRGNLDHVVVGPTGFFAIETKNWKGLITATSEGELTRNGRASTAPHVRRFLSRAMMVREQAIALTHSDDFRVRAVMVFPKAYVEAPYGTTRQVHCVRLNQLRDYIEDPKFSAKLNDSQVDGLIRALHGIAGMDIDFAETTTAPIEAA
ncbi:MAG: hypothetical protein QOI07_1961 [Verrucomicrobiota bacterium]|jgi:hypothetical protein